MTSEAKRAKTRTVWSVIVHGGAGAIAAHLSDSHQAGCRDAVEAARVILDADGSALDAACAAVRVLEDNPIFNAGVGSALDEDGVVSCDAAVFVSDQLQYGGVGAVSGVRHPIDLARAVLEDGRHSLLVGRGAVAFARKRGIELCDPKSMETDPSRSKWWFTEAEKATVSDTVGAVVRDRNGVLVAATSTGGLLRKYAGRVGDSPIAGAGTYARSDLGAISATGHGETILKTVLAYQALLALSGASEPKQILEQELNSAFERARGRAGLIAVLPDGRTSYARNTPHMGVAWAESGRETCSDF